jgi:Tol biopolymer transport system component
MLQQKITRSRLFVIGAVLCCTNFAMSQFPVGQYDIYRVEVKTGGVVQISSIPNAGEFNITWSPDGRKIAHDVVGEPAPLGHAIFITNIASGESTPIDGAEGGNDASWSPNGRKIAFDRAPVGDPSIYVLPCKGGIPILVRNDAVDPDWSRNSKRLVFHQPSDGSIRTVKEDGSAETFVDFGNNPVWSPNGLFIAFARAGDIWKIRVNSLGIPLEPAVQVTSDPADDGQPSWSNNSKTIVFHSNRETGDFDIWTIPVSGGTATRLTGLIGQGDFDPSFSNNGRFIAYAGFTEPAPPKMSTMHEVSGPSSFSLEQNYPNPFNPETEISFVIPEASRVVVKIFNLLGTEVRTLVDEQREAGYHQARWNGKDEHGNSVASGVYLYRLQATSISSGQGFSQTRKMNLLQ